MSAISLECFEFLEPVVSMGNPPRFLARVRGDGGSGTDTTVAIRPIPPRIARDYVLLACLRRELSRVMALEHDRLARVLGMGDKDGEHFIVQEFVPGLTLGERLAQPDRLDREAAFEILRQVAEGLAAAHGHGIAHHCLRPHKIKLQTDGSGYRVKLLDLGLASLEPEDPSEPGVLAYLAPEQIKRDVCDCRTDVFTLASIAFETIVGQSAFAAEGGTMRQQIHAAEPDLPAGLTELQSATWQKALARRPYDRFESTLELMAALERSYPRASSTPPLWARQETLQLPRLPAPPRPPESATMERAPAVPPAPAPPPPSPPARPRLEETAFTYYRSLALRPGGIGLFVLFHHPEDPADELRERMDTQARALLARLAGSGPDPRGAEDHDDNGNEPRRGLVITYRPIGDGLDFRPSFLQSRFDGRLRRQVFKVRADPRLDGKVARGKLIIYAGSRVLARVALAMPVSSALPDHPLPPHKESFPLIESPSPATLNSCFVDT